MISQGKGAEIAGLTRADFERTTSESSEAIPPERRL
jgi:hypothetical protein